MLTLKVPLKQAEKWKRYLIDNKLLDQTHRAAKEDGFIYYPLVREFTVVRGDIEFIDRPVQAVERSGTFKDNLKQRLSAEEMEIVKAAHDTVGSIAIIEVPKELEHHEKLIAETLLKVNPQIKTVLKKAASHEGTFRTQKMQHLAGLDTKETIYKENGVQLKLDVEQVYFSVRLSTERKRIMQLVKPGEDILVMFSGCAPYPIVLAKNTKARHILGIEINPEGHRYGLENIRLNKVKNVELICGDVHDVAPQLAKKSMRFDRILMPLPKTADEFLGDALMLSKKGTVIHFYDFLAESEFDDAYRKIDDACKKAGLRYRLIKTVRCGQHAPHVFRICVDFEIC